MSMPLQTTRASPRRVPGETKTSPSLPAPSSADVTIDVNNQEWPSSHVVEFSDSSAAPSSRPSGLKSVSQRTQAFEDGSAVARELPVGGNFFMAASQLSARADSSSTPRDSQRGRAAASTAHPADDEKTRSASSSPAIPQYSSSDDSHSTGGNDDALMQDEQLPLHAQPAPPRSNQISLTNAASVDSGEVGTRSARSTHSLPRVAQTRGAASSSLTSRGISPPLPNDDDDEHFQPFTASMRSDAGVQNPQSHSPSPRTRILCESPEDDKEGEEDTDSYAYDDDNVVVRESQSSSSAPTSSESSAYGGRAGTVDFPTDTATDDEEARWTELLGSTPDTVMNRYDVKGDAADNDDVPAVSHFIDLNEDDDDSAVERQQPGSAVPEADAAEDEEESEEEDESSCAFPDSHSSSSSQAESIHGSEDGGTPIEEPADTRSVGDDSSAEHWRAPAPRNLDDSEAARDGDMVETVDEVKAKGASSGGAPPVTEKSRSSTSFADVPDVPSLPPPLPAAKERSPRAWPRNLSVLPPPTDIYHRGSSHHCQHVPAPHDTLTTSSSNSSTESDTVPRTASSTDAVQPVPSTSAEERVEPPPPWTRHVTDTQPPATSEPPPTRRPQVVIPLDRSSRMMAVPATAVVPTGVSRKYPQYFGLPSTRPSPMAPAQAPHAVFLRPHVPREPPALNQCADCAACPHCDHSVCSECGKTMHEDQHVAVSVRPEPATLLDRGERVGEAPNLAVTRHPARVQPTHAEPEDAWRPPVGRGDHDSSRHGGHPQPHCAAEPPDAAARTNPWEDNKQPPAHKWTHPLRPYQAAPSSSPRDGRLSWSTTPTTQALPFGADDEAYGNGNPRRFADDHTPELEVLTRGTYPAPMVVKSTKPGQQFSPYADEPEPSRERAPVPTPRDSIAQPLPRLGHPTETYRDGTTSTSSSRRAPPPADETSPVPLPPPTNRLHRDPHIPADEDNLTGDEPWPVPNVERTLPLDVEGRDSRHKPPPHHDGGNVLPTYVGRPDRTWRRYLDSAQWPHRPSSRPESRASTLTGGTSGRASRGGGGAPWSGCAPGAWDGRPRTPATTPDATAERSASVYSRRSVSPTALCGARGASPTRYIVYRGQSASQTVAVTGVMVPISVRAPSLEAVVIRPRDPDEEAWRQMVRKMELEKERLHTESRLRRDRQL